MNQHLMQDETKLLAVHLMLSVVSLKQHEYGSMY